MRSLVLLITFILVSACASDEFRPLQVSNVDVTLNGSSTTISWQTDELSIGSVEYGLTPSYELGTLASGTRSTAHAVTLTGLTSGTIYHYRITAEDTIGNAVIGDDATFTSAVGTGPNIDVWYGSSQSFGQLGNPQQWVNVLGQVIDPDGLSALTYSLNGGAPQDLSVGPFRRLAEPGDFNVELDYTALSPGVNTIEIRAVDTLGFESIETVNLDYTAGTVWPLGYQVDWSSASQVSDVAQVVDGRWSIVNGALRNDLLRYDRGVAIGDITWTDYEVTVPVTIHGFSTVGFEPINTRPAVGVMLKWPGHSDREGSQPRWGFHPGGGGAWYEFLPDSGGQLRLTDFTSNLSGARPLAIPFDTTYVFKVRVESQGGASALYQVKVWEQGTPEPTGWELVDTDNNDVPGGCLLLVAHFTDVSFGNIVIDPL